MDRKQKGFVAIYAILILVILSVAGYFILQSTLFTKDNSGGVKPSPQISNSSPTSTLTRRDDIPEDWKTYTSQKYNFEFKYPSEARLSDQSEGYVAVSYMGEKQKASGRTQTELFDGYSFNVADVTGEGYQNLDDFYNHKVDQLKDVCTEIGDPKETTISGRRAITQKLSCLGDYDSYYVLDGDTYFDISLLYVGDKEDLPVYIETVNKIFSTFRFTN